MIIESNKNISTIDDKIEQANSRSRTHWKSNNLYGIVHKPRILNNVNEIKRNKIYKLLKDHTVRNTENKLQKLKNDTERINLMRPMPYIFDKSEFDDEPTDKIQASDLSMKKHEMKVNKENDQINPNLKV